MTASVSSSSNLVGQKRKSGTKIQQTSEWGNISEADLTEFSSSDEDDSDNDIEGAKVTSAKSGEDATDAKDQGNEAVNDSNTDLDGRDKVMTEVEDTHVTLTPV
ncbi:hypothetical protein Tco_1370783 [Tanacetum coccineum]